MCDIRDVSLTAEKPQNTHTATEVKEPFKPQIPTKHFALINYQRNRCIIFMPYYLKMEYLWVMLEKIRVEPTKPLGLIFNF